MKLTTSSDYLIEDRNSSIYLSNGLKIQGKILLPPFFPFFSGWIKLVSQKSTIFVNTQEIISIQYFND